MNQTRPVVTVTLGSMGPKELFADILNPVSELHFLDAIENPSEQLRVLAKTTCLLGFRPSTELPEAAWQYASNWRFIQLISAGAEQMEFGHLRPDTLVACNAGAYGKPMAEHVLAMALGLEKKLLQNHRLLEKGEFNQWETTGTLDGKVCGVLGFGGIGKESAKWLRLLGMRIHAINSTGKTTEEVDFIGTLNDLEQVMRAADLLLISLPHTRRTDNLLGSRELAWLKPTAKVINVARGSILDEEAFYLFLKNHPQAAAGIDAWWIEPVFHGKFGMNFPFLELPNVLGSPHNSARTPGAMPTAMRQAAQNVADFIAGKPLIGVLKWDAQGLL